LYDTIEAPDVERVGRPQGRDDQAGDEGGDHQTGEDPQQ